MPRFRAVASALFITTLIALATVRLAAAQTEGSPTGGCGTPPPPPGSCVQVTSPTVSVAPPSSGLWDLFTLSLYRSPSGGWLVAAVQRHLAVAQAVTATPGRGAERAIVRPRVPSGFAR